MLNISSIGGGPNQPLLIAHGLFGSLRNWSVVAKRLADSRRVVLIDMRNHGSSAWKASHNYADLADDLSRVISSQGGQMDVLGHSMGGKAAMALALVSPNSVNRLIVADIAPVSYQHDHRKLIAAMKAVKLVGLERREDADKQLEPSISDRNLRSFLLQSLDPKSSPPAWRFNLDVLEQEMDNILNWPSFEARFLNPALFLSGGSSDYVKADHHPEIKRHFPQARFSQIPNAGHWLHADNPREFVSSVSAFLE